MRNIIYIFVLVTLLSCNQEVSITPIEVSSSWRGTPGKLVVKKGDLVDTIYDCHFGIAPEYKLLKHLDKEYLYSINILGEKINRSLKNQIIFDVYIDGSITKRYVH